MQALQIKMFLPPQHSNNIVTYLSQSTDPILQNFKFELQEISHNHLIQNYMCRSSASSLIYDGHVLSKMLKIRIYKIIILPVVLYEHGIWSLNLKEEHKTTTVWKQSAQENIWTWKGWSEQFRILYNEKLCDLYRSSHIVRIVKFRRLQWAGHVVTMGETSNVYRLSVGKTSQKTSTWRLRRRWGDNIKVENRLWESEEDGTGSGLCPILWY